MPELPEVETTKEGLKRDLLGQKILKVEISDKKLRFPYDKNFIKRITGEYILSITRRAKYIIFILSNDLKIIYIDINNLISLEFLLSLIHI